MRTHFIAIVFSCKYDLKYLDLQMTIDFATHVSVTSENDTILSSTFQNMYHYIGFTFPTTSTKTTIPNYLGVGAMSKIDDLISKYSSLERKYEKNMKRSKNVNFTCHNCG